MSDTPLDPHRDDIPAYVRGELDAERAAALEAKMAADPDLASEAALISALAAHRPEPPADLTSRIEAGLAQQRRVGRRHRWEWSVAAVLVLSLGTAWLWGSRVGAPDTTAEVAPAPLPSTFLAADVLVAVAALLDDLSEEALRALLDEMGG